MAQMQVGLRMERSLFDRVNEARGREPRNAWIVRALEATLGDKPETTGLEGAPASPRASDWKPAAVAGVARASELFRSTESGRACPGCDEAMAARVDPKAGALWVCPSCGTRAKREEET